MIASVSVFLYVGSVGVELLIRLLFSLHRSVLEPLAQWDSPMQVKLSCWKSGLNTLLVELLPWALLANYSHWDLWLFEGETIVLQIPAGKVIVPPNFKVGWQSNFIYESIYRKIKIISS